jgi:hypothetical protein
MTVAARSKAWTLFARSNAEIVGSNPTQGMDICVRLFCVCTVLCAGSQVAAFQLADPPSKESYRLCKKIKKLNKSAKVQQRAVEPQIDKLEKVIQYSNYVSVSTWGWPYKV